MSKIVAVSFNPQKPKPPKESVFSWFPRPWKEGERNDVETSIVDANGKRVCRVNTSRITGHKRTAELILNVINSTQDLT